MAGDGKAGVAALGLRRSRRARCHVIFLDGTLSSLAAGDETNIGRIYGMLKGLPAGQRPTLFYEEGIQWRDWRASVDVITGTGINRQIRRAYGALATRYRVGDRIYLFGYSRGAFAVRSLAGLIDRIGLIRPRFATEQMVRQLYRHYERDPHGPQARVFARRFCHPEVEIQMVGVFDTVKALGWPLPVAWRLSAARHAFHTAHLGQRVRHGYHALALNETRAAFAPLLWHCADDWTGHAEQVWFRGIHGDVGGQVAAFPPARPLANIPLVWMLEKAEGCGLPLPSDWRRDLPCDASAPSLGGWRGWSKAFPLRKRRSVGLDRSEHLHPSAVGARSQVDGLPLAPDDGFGAASEA
ncbi:hypothetical protein BV911_04390 [Pseudoruegeria sp. SK021]|nr:hypothetical protein BV911_04390 [Pseudoruegeria sp. SK021]